MNDTIPEAHGYEELQRVLNKAYAQSALGKGRERHANNRPFHEQPICTIPQTIGGIEGFSGLIYQVHKKSNESVGMLKRGDSNAAQNELLGAIVYLAAAYLHSERVRTAKRGFENPFTEKILEKNPYEDAADPQEPVFRSYQQNQ